MRFRFSLAMAAAVTLLAACGSPDSAPAGDGGPDVPPPDASASAESAAGGDAGLPSIDPATNLRSITATQKGELCDWVNGVLGGYGTEINCGAGTIRNDRDQAQCVAIGLKVSLRNCDGGTGRELRARANSFPRLRLAERAVSLALLHRVTSSTVLKERVIIGT